MSVVKIRNAEERRIVPSVAKPGETTWGEILDRYALKVLTKKAPTTIAKEKSQLRIFRKYFGEQTALSKVDTAFIKQFLNDRAESGVKMETIRRDTTLLSLIFKYAAKWGYSIDNPVSRDLRL